MPELGPKRYRTAIRIQKEAIKLAKASGLSNVTIEEIAKAADISLRTFYNYYAFKEAAILGPLNSYPDDAVAKFLSGSSTNIHNDLLQLIIADLQKYPHSREEARTISLLTDSDPKLSAVQQHHTELRREQLANLISKRLSERDSRYSWIIASTAMSCVVVASRAWVKDAEIDLLQYTINTYAMIPRALGYL